VSLSGITQYLLGVEFLRGRETFIMIGKYKKGIEAITACFSHPNAFAVYLTIPLMICISCLTTFRMSHKRFYASIVFLTTLLGYCFFYTYSRGAWISLAGALFFMMIISKKKSALISAFVFFGILLLLPQSRVLIFSMVESGCDADRFKYWQTAFAMVKEHPFLGQGLGTFMQNFGKHQPDLQISYAHNCYLQVLAETGLFGLIAFLAFVSRTIYKSVRAFFCAKDALHLGAICGMIGYLMHSFFENNLYSLPLAVLFWVWLGLVSSLSSQGGEAIPTA
jgi:putative inorganic carbon (HCO3(-)) transporter